MGVLCSCLKEQSETNQESSTISIPLLELENSTAAVKLSDGTNFISPLSLEANAILNDRTSTTNLISSDGLIIKQNRRLSIAAELVLKSTGIGGGLSHSNLTPQMNESSTTTTIANNTILVGSSFNTLHSQFAPEIHTSSILFPSPHDNSSSSSSSSSSSATTLSSSSSLFFEAQKIKHDQALFNRIKLNTELQKSLANIVERAEENFMDVRRGVDDIEREDPTDPAAVSFVRTLRQVDVEPLKLPVMKGR
jgi:hypothetical protein